MALDARSRSSIYEKLAALIGEQDANALMSEFPSVEADELVTKQFLRAELAEVRSEFRTELNGGLGHLRTEMHAETAGLRADMAERFHQQTLWLGGGLAGATALILAAIPLLS